MKYVLNPSGLEFSFFLHKHCLKKSAIVTQICLSSFDRKHFPIKISPAAH